MRGSTLRLLVLATALVVGPATLAPVTAEAPGPVAAARATDGTTAAKRYGWGEAQWDFGWEFGESLGDGAYTGRKFGLGSWSDDSTGTGRVVKYGGGLEFHSGEVAQSTNAPDRGTTTLRLEGLPAKRGRWELRERIHFYPDRDAPGGKPYRFVVELVPEDPAQYDCGRHNITVADTVVGGSTVKIQANAGGTSWRKTLKGFGRKGDEDDRFYGLQITKKRITWFVNGTAVASLAAAAALPKTPMTVRMRLVGEGNDTEMKKTDIRIDWVRGFDLARGKKTPKGASLTKGRGVAC
ncbi:hypothetical protein DJ010_02740 [Nocardioides silvaticus]|uniref:GH16 domain-containing protein n=1 Tax=Nocardioides silvaticus TaxID=2201891 RepID=A0A316TIX3_9ACTN|nr:hypothetical protein [Nocardioides silvaticus]PWN04563.1 hypothetical protein DJ010_02740 [Nocardioides silvaticus]